MILEKLVNEIFYPLDTKRNITQKKKSDYEDYLDISSSIVSRKKNRSIGKLLF
jgi:hypothetical protein